MNDDKEELPENWQESIRYAKETLLDLAITDEIEPFKELLDLLAQFEGFLVNEIFRGSNESIPNSDFGNTLDNLYEIIIQNKSKKIIDHVLSLSAISFYHPKYCNSYLIEDLKDNIKSNPDRATFIFDAIVCKQNLDVRFIYNEKLLHYFIETKSYDFLIKSLDLIKEYHKEYSSKAWGREIFELYLDAITTDDKFVISALKEFPEFLETYNLNAFLHSCKINNKECAIDTLNLLQSEEVEDGFYNKNETIIHRVNNGLLECCEHGSLETFIAITSHPKAKPIIRNQNALHEYLIVSIDSNQNEITKYLLTHTFFNKYIPLGEVFTNLRPKRERGEPELEIRMGCWGGPTYEEAVGNDRYDILISLLRNNNLELLKFCVSNKDIWGRIEPIYKEQIFDYSLLKFSLKKEIFYYLVKHTDIKSILTTSHLTRIYVELFASFEVDYEAINAFLEEFNLDFDKNKYPGLIREVGYEVTEKNWSSCEDYILEHLKFLDEAESIAKKHLLKVQLEKELDDSSKSSSRGKI